MKTIRNEHEHYLKTAYAKRHPYNVPATATGEVVYNKTTGFTITFGEGDITLFTWASSPSPTSLSPAAPGNLTPTPTPITPAVYLQDFMSLASLNGDTRLFMIYIHTTLSIALLSRAERNPNTHYGFGLKKKYASRSLVSPANPATPTSAPTDYPLPDDEATYQKELAIAKERYEKLLSLRPQQQQQQCEQILEPSTKKME